MPLFKIDPNYDFEALLVEVSEDEVAVLEMPYDVESVSMMFGPVEGNRFDGMSALLGDIPPECEDFPATAILSVAPDHRLSRTKSTSVVALRQFAFFVTSAIAALVADLAIFHFVGIDPYGLKGLLIGKSAIPGTIGALIVSSAFLAVCTCVVRLRRQSVREETDTTSKERARKPSSTTLSEPVFKRHWPHSPRHGP